MFRISRLQELLKGLSRGAFDRMVEAHGSDKHSKGFGSWRQMVAMIYGQLADVGSLRELEAGFNGQRTHHYHLDCRAVRRSTLAEANARRDPALFATVVQSLMTQVERTARRGARRFLVALDSTSITLQGRGFDRWTASSRTGRTQGIKVHVAMVATGSVPIAQSITRANVNDIEEGRKLTLVAGTIYVFDKGYCDYGWWHRIDEAGGCS